MESTRLQTAKSFIDHFATLDVKILETIPLTTTITNSRHLRSILPVLSTSRDFWTTILVWTMP